MRLERATDPRAMDDELRGGCYENHSGEDLGNVSRNLTCVPKI